MIPIKFENENILVDIVNKYQYKIESIIDRKYKKNGKKVSELIENELKKFCAFFEIESIAFSDLIKLPFSRIKSLKEKIDKKYDECNNRFFAECEEFNFHKFKVYYKDIFYDDKYGSEDSKNYGLAHINNLGVEVCPYCNIGYTFATPNKRLCEFDHFFSQDKYPIFALSFYNLIPVCHNCNHKKRENDLKLLSPFDSNLKYDTFKFFPKPKEQIGKFSIVLTNPNGKEKNQHLMH